MSKPQPEHEHRPEQQQQPDHPHCHFCGVCCNPPNAEERKKLENAKEELWLVCDPCYSIIQQRIKANLN